MAIHMLKQESEIPYFGQCDARRQVNTHRPLAPVTKDQLSLSLAKTSAERSAAESLLNRRYEWRGYGSSHKIRGSSNRTTFLAHLGQQLAGTITLAVDTEEGLAIDTLFKDVVDEYRNAPGAQICELTRFAFEKDEKGENNSLLARLFHAVFIYGMSSYRCTDLFIEVNPRHRRFYQAMLGFKPVGGLRMNATVDAPSQLMWISVSEVAEQIAAFRSEPAKPSRSLYSLFLSEAEEAMVMSRLAIGREPDPLSSLFERR